MPKQKKEEEEGKPTHGHLAFIYKVSRQTISSWKKQGVNIYDAQDVAEHIKGLKRPPETWRKAASVDVANNLDDLNSIDLDDIEGLIADLTKKVMASRDGATCRLFQAKIKSFREVIKLKVEAGESTPNSKIKEDMMRISSGINGAIRRLQADLPPLLEGLTAGQMSKEIENKGYEILEMLNDASSDLYRV